MTSGQITLVKNYERFNYSIQRFKRILGYTSINFPSVLSKAILIHPQLLRPFICTRFEHFVNIVDDAFAFRKKVT